MRYFPDHMRSTALSVDFNMAGIRSQTDPGKKGKDKNQSHVWNDKEVEVLLDSFSEETIQFSLSKIQKRSLPQHSRKAGK